MGILPKEKAVRRQPKWGEWFRAWRIIPHVQAVTWESSPYSRQCPFSPGLGHPNGTIHSLWSFVHIKHWPTRATFATSIRPKGIATGLFHSPTVTVLGNYKNAKTLYVIMPQMFSALDSATLSLAKELPLEWFVIIASFIEEVIAPVPALAVLMTTGSLAAIQGRTVPELLPLILLATIGKSIGAIIVYFLAGKIGGLMVSKFGKFFEITPEDIDRLGSKITGGPRDYLILTLIRAAPIIPSSVVSVGSGLLKIPFRVYMVATVLGTIVRDGFFLYVGYTGTEFLSTLATDTDNVESLLQNGFILIVLVSLMYLFYRRRKQNKAGN